MHTLPVRKYKKLQFKCFIGVDEAGRGPLAGPLSVGAVFIKDKNVLRKFAGVKDSKKLSEKKREEWFSKIGNAETKKLLSYEVALVSPKEIDAKGMSYCLREGVRRSLLRFVSEKERALVLLDGTLRAPYKADILLRGKTIAAIGTFLNKKATKTIDALGLYCAPGFIDINTDADHYLGIVLNPAQKDSLVQGITTIIGGHCG